MVTMGMDTRVGIDTRMNVDVGMDMDMDVGMDMDTYGKQQSPRAVCEACVPLQCQ